MKLSVLFILGILYSLAENVKISQFTANVYKELAKTNSKTFMVCPLSIKIIFALLQLGAGGKTKQEIAQVLELPGKYKYFKNYIRWLLGHLKGNSQYVLKSANKIYVNDKIRIKKRYKRKAIYIFNVQIQNMNFKNNIKAAKKINRWAERHTNDKIKNLVAPEMLGEDTILILINAMYFHGTWMTKFPKGGIKKRLFYGYDDIIHIDMMKLKTKFSYRRSETLQAQFLELPYKGQDVTMTIILPERSSNLSVLEKHIADVLLPIEYDFKEVTVIIPKFKVSSNVQFRPILENLGIREAFVDANFSGIAKSPSYVSEVVQKTFIEVNEEGTTAGAATVAVVRTRMKTDRPEFIANRPFIFYLKSKIGVIFIGRYMGTLS